MPEHGSVRFHSGTGEQRLLTPFARALLCIVLGAAVGSCTFAGYCCGRLTDFDETTGSDRRKVKKELREKHEEELEEAAEDLLDEAKDRREKGDLAEYYEWLAKELDLAKVWTESRAKSGLVRSWRVTTLDGVYGDAGGFASVRVIAVPDWSWLVTTALKRKFELEFDKSDRDKLARDLWLGGRFAIDLVDAGVPGIDVELSIESENMPPGFGPVSRVLGSARTDTGGRATIALGPGSIPGNVPPLSYELTAKIANAPSTVERDEPGHLHVRRGDGRGVVLVDAEDVLDWRGTLQTRQIVERERFTPRDYCVRASLESIAKSNGIAIVSAAPDTREPVFRKGLVASGAADVHPRSIALHFDAKPASLAERYRAALGANGIAGLVTSDPAKAESFAKATGAKAWTLAAPRDGGWCAGLPGLLAPKP